MCALCEANQLEIKLVKVLNKKMLKNNKCNCDYYCICKKNWYNKNVTKVVLPHVTKFNKVTKNTQFSCF